MIPDLRSYDVILINSSAGKDSQAMLDYVHALAVDLGVADRIVVVHADLGRAEWQGTAELAERQAAHYGARFVKVRREQSDLLEHVERRRMWPSPRQRFCTSDHKRAPIHRVFTQLVSERASAWTGGRGGRVRQVRILNCMGLRAEESPARARRSPFSADERASNGRRQVDTWLPIHDWTVGQVWERIRASGVPHHRAYDLGMQRLSCVFCIFAGRDALLLAGHHNRELLEDYARVEQTIGHTFKRHLPIAEIRDAVARGERPTGLASFESGL